MHQPATPIESPSPVELAGGQEVERLRDLSSTQWKSGIAAWLGWLFDGLDMHLYTLVATPFVTQLLGPVGGDSEMVTRYASWIQAAFLVGWALGGGFFGRVGDRLGRSRALMLTILTYALFTGLSFFAQTWWHLLICRFLAALGIGGEWAVGASLLSETWPRRWRPWIAAVLQTAVNVGILLACLAGILLAGFPERTVFLVGIVPALLVLWIRSAVPEPEEWHQAKRESAHAEPGIADLFRGEIRRTMVLSVIVCATGLTAHWAFTFWYVQHLRSLPDVVGWPKDEKQTLVSLAFAVLMVSAIAGNFLAAWLARWLGYRRAIAALFLCYFLAMCATYGVERDYVSTFYWIPVLGACSGVFALFTMYLPPLFPTLLRTTGAGFCYNIGRIAAACGTVVFVLWSQVGDYRLALFGAGFLFLPAAAVALMLTEPPDERLPAAPLE